MKRAVRRACVLAHQVVLCLLFGALAAQLLWGALPARAQAPVEDARAHVYVQPLAEVDELAAQRLDLLLGRPLPRLAADVDPHALLQGDAAAVVVVLDSSSARVTRHRQADLEPLVRTLAEPQPSPYQMAFVAAEMLPLDGPVRAPAEPAPRTARVYGIARVQGAASSAVAGVSPLLELGAGLGVGFVLSELRALELELDAGYGAGRRRSYGDGELRLTRTRVRMRASLVRRSERLEGALGLELGLARAFAHADGYAEQSRRSVSAAVRGEGRVLLGPRWGLFAAVSAGTQGARHAYEVQGDRLARERRYYGEAQVGLLVVLGNRAGQVHRARGLE